VNTQAQNDTTWHVIESGILNSGISTLTGTIDGTVVSITGWKISKKPFDDNLTIEGLLNLYDQYAKECHAKSIKHDRLKEGYQPYIVSNFTAKGLSWKIDSTRVCSKFGYSPLPRFYFNKRSTSFEGFIAWLRKQSSK
jgi:maltose-binding protein MalE